MSCTSAEICDYSSDNEIKQYIEDIVLQEGAHLSDEVGFSFPYVLTPGLDYTGDLQGDLNDWLNDGAVTLEAQNYNRRLILNIYGTNTGFSMILVRDSQNWPVQEYLFNQSNCN